MQPGTQLFLATLLAHVRSALPGFPLEPTILQVLLLCIIAGDRNLILRTRDEDIGLVTKLAAMTLGSVFGYNVHRSRCHPDTRKQSPGHFLTSLFFPSSPTADGTSHKSREGHRQASSSRNAKGKSVVHPEQTGISSVPRSPSFPTVSRSSAPFPGIVNPGSGTPDVGNIELELPITDLKRPSLHSFGDRTESSISAFNSRKRLQHAGLLSSIESLDVPNAVVVSGLECASLQAQKAVLQALADRKLILSDDQANLDLPGNFILVYVCGLDARETPPIYQSLLDRFAMSSAVDVSQQTRLAVRQYRLPSTPSSAQPSPNILGPAAHSTVPPISPGFIGHLKSLCANHTHMRQPLDIYLADLFTATRHFGSLDAMLLTVRARQDAEALIRASRVLGVDPTGSELIREAAHSVPENASSDVSSSTQGSYPPCSSVASVSSDALLDTINVPDQEPSNGYRGFVADIFTLTKDVLELDVSEADIARMFPRVVSHRVRVRDSPFDEVLSSAICGLVRPSDADGRELLWERSTVKDILVRILSAV